jgi:hypothetical protein
MKRGGKYSRFLPVRLAARYREALEDPELSSLRDEIAVAQVRLEELLSRLEEGSDSLPWQKALRLVEQAKAKDGAAQQKALADLEALLQRGATEADTWGEVRTGLETLRRLKETEHERLSALGQFVTVAQLNVLIGTLLIAIRDHVEDPHARARLASEIRRLGDYPGGRGALPGPDGE